MVFEEIAGFAAIVVVLFLPGYCLTLGLFTRKSDTTLLERVLLSFAFTLTILPLLLLLGNVFLGVPIAYPAVLATFLLIAAVGLASYAARIRILPLPGILQKIFPAVKKSEAVSIIPIGKK